MKRLVSLSVVFAAFVALTSCSGAKSFGKMEEGFVAVGDAGEVVTYNCVPEVLTLVNGEVSADINVDFPADYFSSKVIVKVTPVVVYQGGEQALEPLYYQGEKVEDNFTVIPEEGKKISEHITFEFKEEMRLSELQLRFELRNAKKEQNPYYLVNASTGELLSKDEQKIMENEPESAAAAAIRKACGVTVAKGINTLQEDFRFDKMMEDMAHNYKAVITSYDKADVKYNINSSTVSKKAMDSQDVRVFKIKLADNHGKENTTQTVFANGYASPDGPETLNDKLSKARSESAAKSMKSFLKDMGLEADAASYGEDWDGFKELVQASDIQDKNLILQVLSLYDSSTQREAEIKNLASVYTELKEEILPQLRRAQLINQMDVKGMTSDELMELVSDQDYGKLTVEEVLYLCENTIKYSEVKIDILEYAAKKFGDARVYNNLGVAYAEIGKFGLATKAFEDSTRKGASDVTINKNLVLSNLAEGKYAEAKKYSADEVSSAAVAAIEGNYSPAAKSFKGYNAAVAHVLNNNYAAAKSALKDCDDSQSNYLRAVIASAEGDVTNGTKYLKAAIAANPYLAKKAKNDVNLAALFEGGLEL